MSVFTSTGSVCWMFLLPIFACFSLPLSPELSLVVVA